MKTTKKLQDLTRHQHGVVSRHQLTALGYNRQWVARAVAAGRLERISPRVLLLAGSAATPSQKVMAATLDVPGAAVALQSAAAMWRLPGFDLEPVHVLTTRRPHRDRSHLGRMHSTVRLEPGEVTSIDAIPVTTPLRTLHDLAGRIHPERLSLACDRMLGARLMRLEALHSLGADLPSSGGSPRAKALRTLIERRPAGRRPPESNLELRFESIIERAGDPPFERQADVGDEDGWIGRVDFIDRDLGVIVEVQSALFHAGLVDGERDARRIGRLRRAGWIVVEVSDHEVWHRPEIVVARIRSARSRARNR